jgi:hypothetical protein
VHGREYALLITALRALRSPPLGLISRCPADLVDFIAFLSDPLRSRRLSFFLSSSAKAAAPLTY